MIWKIIIYLSGGINIILIFHFLNKILERDRISHSIFEKDRANKIIIPLLVLISMNIFIVNSLTGDNFYLLIFALLISSAVYHYILEIDLITTMRYLILAYLIMGLMKMISATILILFFRVEPELLFQKNMYKALRIIIVQISFFFFTEKYLIKIEIPKLSKGRERIFCFMGFLNAFIIYIAYTIFKDLKADNIADIVHLLGLLICSVFITIFLYRIGKESAIQEQRESMLKSREEFLNKSDFYLASMEEILVTIRRQSHDMNNYLGTLYGLIYMKKFDRAKEYIEKMNKEIKDINSVVNTNNPALTALLTIKKHQSYKKEIHIKHDIDFPEEIEMDYIDMSIIVGNLLDNAIEACEEVDQNTNREININIYLKDGILYIQVRNNKIRNKKFKVDELSTRFTTKKDTKNHGYGIGNIGIIVNKYNGEMRMQDKGDMFETKIKLSLSEKVLSK